MRLIMKRVLQTTPALLIMMGLVATTTVPAQAFIWFLDPHVREYHDHFIYCKELGLKDHKRHKKECGPFPKHPARFSDPSEEYTPPARLDFEERPA